MRRKNFVLRCILAFMLALLMCVSAVPANVFAETTTKSEVTITAGDQEYDVIEGYNDGSAYYYAKVPEKTDITFNYKESRLFDYFEDYDFNELECTATEEGKFSITSEQLLECAAYLDIYDYAASYGVEMEDTSNKLAYLYVCSGSDVVIELFVEILPEGRVTLDQDSIQLQVGENTELTATVELKDSTADKSVTWSSSDEAVAMVDANGSITAIKKETTFCSSFWKVN